MLPLSSGLDPPLSNLVAQGYLLLDVCTVTEFDESPVKGAINIDLAKLNSLTLLLGIWVLMYGLKRSYTALIVTPVPFYWPTWATH